MHDSFAVHVGHCLAGSRLMKATFENSLTKHLQEHQKGKRSTSDAQLPSTYHQLPVSSDLRNLLHNTRSFRFLAVPSAFRIIPATFSGTVRGSHHVAATWLSWAAPCIGQETQETPGDQKVGLLGPKRHRDPAMASSALPLLCTNKGPESQDCCEDVERTLRCFCSIC